MTHSPRILLIASSKQERTPAFERAVALAKASGAGLSIVAFDYMNALEIMGLFNHDALTSLRDSYVQAHHRWLELQAEQERGRGLDVCVNLLWTEKVLDEIQAYVSALAPSMLIKDIHHESAIHRLFSTPLDWHLLRHCLCPIQWVVGSTHALPRKVLAAVNLYRSDDDDLRLNDDILGAASRLAAQCQASLQVVYVYDWSAIYAAGVTMMGAMPIEDGFQEALSDAHKEAFSLLCEKHGILGNRQHFLGGTPQPTIEAFARQNDFDLLVMGTLPQHGLERIMGNTAETLLAHAPCSVLVVKKTPMDSKRLWAVGAAIDQGVQALQVQDFHSPSRNPDNALLP